MFVQTCFRQRIHRQKVNIHIPNDFFELKTSVFRISSSILENELLVERFEFDNTRFS